MRPRAPKGFKRNQGRCPDEAIDKRVEVILANGSHIDPNVNGPGYPNGWAASGKGRCRWSLTNQPWDIEFYRVLGG